MAVFEIQEIEFHNIMAQEFAKNQIVILKFGSEFCDACHALESELEDLEEDNENVSLLLIDCNDCQDLAEQYHVHRLPTMVIYKDSDTILYRREGVVLSQDIEEIIS
ncbi:thioredoxin family protein [Sulfurimonas sp.]|uniref:thioredoxin family protein n=1 Tax=Sulfurimonas sp. TaxID=2022749 RepID=UPI00262C5666|nr:thioredoxin family protein [Sulfurimonas sp.]MCW8895139.1 thioredoxin family protein [Sulfurimonas sp.]MCW9068283.1 thioredoxin family protein [Sulfurimonas sp.]